MTMCNSQVNTASYLASKAASVFNAGKKKSQFVKSPVQICWWIFSA